jgi:carboxylesterase type B
MVFIHGGNFDHMFAGALIFNGENIALKGNVIVVNMDYRIGKNIVHPHINVRENRRGN